MESNLSAYHIFNTVARTGNISHAAVELFISQPAISKAIHKLEENLSVKLFIRSSRGVRLTDEGVQLYKYTSSAFETLETGEESLKRIRELGVGHIRIGVSTTLCKYLLIPYLKQFVAQYPHIKITIECRSTFHTVELLEQDKLDIGLIGKPESLKKLDFYPVGEIEDVFVATKTYIDNLKLRENSSETDIFKTANLMLLDEKNITRMYIERYFNEHHIETNRILEISNMDLLIDFAKIGLGAACVIKEFVRKELEEQSLVEIPLPRPIEKRQVGFAYLKSHFLSEALKNFICFYQKSRIPEQLF